uniref:amino acid adenylation domain-containing protein n=1 Tax=Longimicrobium sp. TaxID=2029185 RepID=UPI003B3A4898
MSEVLGRVGTLSPERRALLQKILRQQTSVAHEPGAIRPRERGGPAPLSFAQERLWFIDRLEPGSAAYNVPVTWRLGGALDVVALERSLGEIVRRHEALRTTFDEADGSPVQVIAPFGGFALPVEDLSGLGEADREAELRRRASEEASRPFNLAAGPLFRPALLRLGGEDHVLLLSMHHIVSDGWSTGVLFRELSALYAAYREGRESPLPELAVQYADYAVWQREQLAGEALERHLAYWRQHLAGAPELLALPTDHPRPAVQTYRGETVPVDLSPELLERLQALGRSEGATLYMVLLGAFQVLLSKYSGSEDIIVGSPIAGRTRKEAEALIGFFVNTLVLRTALSGDPGFREVLRRVREATLGAYAHQELPFEKLVAELRPERSLSHSPLYQVMFALQNAEGRGGALPGLSVSGVGAELESAKFDLSLELAATPHGLRGGLSYSTDLFERGTVDRMLGHLARVLEQVAADADVRLSRLELLSAAERRMLVEAWNATDTAFPVAPAHQLFEAQVAKTPDATAVVSGADSLTYAQLNARANRLARWLRVRGVGAETRVGLCLERAPEMVVAVLGVLKAGGAYVPLDPSYPAERLVYMAEHSALPVVLTQEHVLGRLPFDARVEVVPLDARWEEIEREDAADPSVVVDPRSLAYVLYTSGSTGRPKGVAVEHAQLAAYLAWATRTYPGGGSALHSSLSFDLTVTSLFVPLLSGGAVELVEEEDAVEGLARVLERGGREMLKLTPAHLRVLGERLAERDAVGGAACLVVGGEPLIGEQIGFWIRQLPATVIVNEYGPTETVVGCSIHSQRLAETGAGQVSIGRPVANTRIYVLDARGEPAPIGVPGELHVGGAQVTRGYLGRPGLTAERFVPDPFSADGGARMYRTGDLGRWRADGTLEYLGRTDFQVKVRGFRIELGEIEAVLRGHQSVADCVVMAREDAGDQRLVAYVVGDVDTDALRAHVRRGLPEYMVPSAFVSLDALPLTANGKLDRKALPAPEFAADADRHVAPRTPAEEVMAGIWAEVLQLERVGVKQSFFDLGGHSLLATRVVSRVRELFGVELPLRALFEGPTVAQLAGRVEEMRRAGLPVLPPVVPAERTGRLPLSFAQERLWFIDRLERGSTAYNIPAAWRLGGALDEAALERALEEIVRRHEVLRTVFAQVDGSPVQVIAPFGGFTLPVENLSGLSLEDREAAVRHRVGEETGQTFDLATGPLFRAALLRVDAEDHVLLLSMHHVVSDGWSMGVLFRELSALYAAYLAGRESPLPELAVQYADYAVWQREQLAGEVLDRQMAYWKERLADAPAVLELPTDHPRPAVQTYRGASSPVDLSLELLERLQALGRSEGATLYMVLLGAFQVLLGKYAGSEDVVVGTPIAGRTRREVEDLIGFFVNTLVLRTDLSGDPSFREALRRTREVTLGAYEHQEVPFERLVAELQPERSLTHSPLFQVMFTLQNAEGRGADLPGLEVSGAGAGLASAKFDLSLDLTATPQGLRGGLIYSTDLFDRATINRMLGHLARVLEQVAADADVRLSRLELLGEAERARILEAWNATDTAFPAGACVHELFEAQAARAPDAVAVVWEHETLSYAALNARANRLAHHLRGLGVGPDARVGVCVQRGPEMVVSLLAILKAGGAYVPLDPAYPADRLRYMLEDSAPAALVTQSSLAGTFAGLDVPVVELDASAWAAGPETNPVRAGLTPDHLAYVIYTSGSTGRPKGVMVEHRSLVNHTAWQAAAFGIGAADTVLQRTSISFDASVWELWTPLATGARMLLLSSDAAKDPKAMGRAVAEGGVTIAQFVPTLLQAVLGTLPAGASLPCRILFCGGEPLPAALAEEARLAGVGEVVNLYGPTEATIDSTSHVCAVDGRAPAIGRPIANARMYVLDARGALAPVGVAGELYVGGAGVARGYQGRAGLTAERFVPDPFSIEGGARMYHTGDLGRWRMDGTLEFLGRTDFQVKIRGFRIELGEIEAALRSHDAVRECAVLARAYAGDARVVAYVVGDVEADAIRAHVRRILPDYMVPGAFALLDALPLTPNGKLDRKALPAPDLASAGDRYVAPRTPAEEVLAGIWAEVLRLERVGVEESFFELGGHSLLATRVVSRVRGLFGVELPLRALFEGPTVAEMAGRVEEIRRAGEGAALPPLVAVAREAPLPLSFAQERLWFLHQMDPADAGYNMAWPSRLRGHLDAYALEQALGELVRRHEVLRTTFRSVEQGAVQIVHPAAPVRLPVLDLTGLAPREREHETRRLVREDAERPFDLEHGPLLRATLVRVADEEHVFLLNVHHIVSDGWSMGVLFRELFTLFESFSRPVDVARPASPLPPLAVQYADFAVWQRGWLQGEVLQRQLDWWRERLGGAPPALELPTDRPRAAVASSRGAAHVFRIPAEITRGLRALARREGATLYMVTHAALDLLLSRWSGQEDVVVGSPIAGRTQMGTEGLIGFFVNTLALRIDLSGDPSFQGLLGRVREAALGAYAHQELPFERLVEEVAPERGLSHTPLFQVMFALQNVDAGREAADARLRVEPMGGEIRTVRFDLELDLREMGDELVGNLRFRTDLFDAATIERFAAQYRAVLAVAAASPEERLSRLAILPDEEVRQIRRFGAGTARDRTGDAPVHLLFAEQAVRTPNAPAILFAEELLTYAELDARAGRLATELRSRGVRTGTVVAVCLERGPGVLVALLGVWKAGGVYLPLDPAHPAERLSFLLGDSSASHVLTESGVAGVLPQHDAEVVLLDDITTPRSEEGGAAEEVLPGDLAYLIYTSGSTGTPKAVMVEHAQLTHTLRGSLETLGFASGDVVAALASTSFDISLLELVTPLLAGGAVRIVPHAVARDPETLVEVVADVTVLHAVPALMRQVVEVVRGGAALPSLRLLLVGGDSVPPDLLEDMRALLPCAETRVLYGPTEATIICATYAVPADGAVVGHPLGRPLPGVHLAVRGPRGEMAPLGVPGEVWISGGGVARGYLGRPELNAEKFVGDGAERAYRTGDRARWRADGVLEFLGRGDEQVKVRGFRIEPGEVEAVLREQPGVREAVVLAREDAPGDRRLVAYVVPGADEFVEVYASAGKEQVSEWDTLFDDTYAQEEGDDPTLALRGWNSSYTGEPIPAEEMRGWVEDTVDRILALRPERVLEVGAGTGLLLFRIAPHTQAYVGTDFSAVALEHIRRNAGSLPQVSLAQREGDQLGDYAGAGFDVVIVNSVAQYFPDLDYLLRVLDGAAAALRPGGRIFLGDVRSLPL